LERWLILAAEQNFQVVFPTTPAQYFHCLRRQVLRHWRKPLVILSHKSLLRHPRVASELADCSRGHFKRILEDTSIEAGQCRRILLCSGKVYYDLLQAREDRQRQDVAIVRIEQLYPLPQRELEAALHDYSDVTPVCWVQEEPENMGGYQYIKTFFGERMLDRFPMQYIARSASGSPATGSSASHKLEQAELFAAAFEDTQS
jgi:2-oxoglutarate dehydrogenase E1 component